MEKYLLPLLLLLGITQYNALQIPTTSELIATDTEWQSWRSSHSKQYHDLSEEEARYFIWQDNKRYVEEYNSKNSKMKLGLNQFGDLTNSEFRGQMNGYLGGIPSTCAGAIFLSPSHMALPTEVDWRKEGYVTPVKDQRMCGSCWAFSATGSLEGQHFKATGNLVNLSEQQLIECSWSYGNNGCQGGLMDNAFRYLIKSDGLDTEKSYPYTALESPFCEFNPSTVGATMTNYVDIKSGDEDALQQAVATVGPISVAIDAGHKSFQLYKDGVYDEPECNTRILDHGVLVVGYGTTNGEQDFWLVKNSWNTTWGMDGYIKMSRNKSNQCGIATKASYPVV